MNKRFLRLTLALTAVTWVLLSVLVLSPNSWAQGGGNGGLDRAIEVQEANTDKLMAKQGVEGTAVGRNSGGKAVIKVFVEKKKHRSRVPETLEEVPVVPEVTGTFKARGDTTSKYRPAPIGVSTGHPDITAGTIGARLVDGSGNVYALSNNHVYANENKASTGDNVLQPGPYDGGTNPDDKLGELYDYEPIEFDTVSPHNKVDAAIASSTTSNLDNSTLSDGYGTPDSRTVDPKVGMDVEKYGRTTSQTSGFIDAVNATVDVSYDSGTARFVDQIIIKAKPRGSFSDGGDSGSLVVRDVGENPVGLLFAGSNTSTIANKIDLVLDKVSGNKNSSRNLSVDDSEESSNSAPTVSWVNPVDGDTVSGQVTLQIDASDSEDDTGSLTVEWKVDDGSLTTATYNSDSGYYEDTWDSTSVSDGSHTLTAKVTDSGGKTDSASISISTENTDNAPSVSWVNPGDGDTVGGSVTIEIDASDDRDSGSDLTVEWQVDDGTWNGASYDSNSGTYTATWDTTGVSDGDHDLDARATDSGGNTSSEERITVTVDNQTPGMGVADISFSEKNYGGGKFTDLTTTVSVHEDTDGDGIAETSDNPVGGATVNMTLTHDSDGDGDFDANDDTWNFSGDTDSQGDVEFTLKKAPSGDYEAEVTDITHSSYTYDSSLDADNPDTHTVK